MTLGNEILDLDFKNIFQSKYASIYFLENDKVMLCEVQEAYIPMGEFKEVFNFALEFIKAHPVVKFIFDKRALKAFHQPSMEWYFCKLEA